MLQFILPWDMQSFQLVQPGDIVAAPAVDVLSQRLELPRQGSLSIRNSSRYIDSGPPPHSQYQNLLRHRMHESCKQH